MEMVKAKLIVAALLTLGCSAWAQGTYTWTTAPIDGHFTGTTVPTADNVDQALGTVDGKVYTAPNGRKYKGMVADVARDLISYQPQMMPVKEVLGVAPEDMKRKRPESGLSNMIVDCVKHRTEELTGRHVDVALINFGGIRTHILKGNVVLDDMLSMLPFNNYLSYVALKGEDLQILVRDVVAGGIQPMSGAVVTIKGDELVDVKINGEPIDPERIYGLATIDFLLDGGDHIFAAKNAKELIITEELSRDAVIPFLRQLTAEGKPIEYKKDGRVIEL